MPGEAYIWDCATLPAYRRLRLYTALLVHIVEQLYAEGLCRVWIGADAENRASQSGMALAGFQPVADLVVTRVIGHEQCNAVQIQKAGRDMSASAAAFAVCRQNEDGAYKHQSPQAMR